MFSGMICDKKKLLFFFSLCFLKTSDAKITYLIIFTFPVFKVLFLSVLKLMMRFMSEMIFVKIYNKLIISSIFNAITELFFFSGDCHFKIIQQIVAFFKQLKNVWKTMFYNSLLKFSFLLFLRIITSFFQIIMVK